MDKQKLAGNESYLGRWVEHCQYLLWLK